MEVVGVIVVLAVLLGIGWVVSFLRNQAAKALNRGVLNRDGHNRGRASTQELIEFVAPVPAERVVGTIKSRLTLAEEPPLAFVAALYLAGEQGTTLVFNYGNRVAQTFRSVLVAEDLPEGGSRTLYRVTNWVEGDGIVRGISEMEMLANTVRTVAAELGGSYGSSLPAAVADAALERAEAGSGAQRFCTACGSANLGDRYCTDCGVAVG